VSTHLEDTPNDDGSSLTVRWSTGDAVRADAVVVIERQSEGDSTFTPVGRVRASAGEFQDTRGLRRGARYRYRLAVRLETGAAYGAPTEWVSPRAQWFDRERLGIAVAVAAFSLLVLLMVFRTRRGAPVTVRRIPGLEAVDEAIGRATEMGRPILFSPGIEEADQPGTIAGLSILSKVMERAAASGTRTLVPNRDPVVMTIAREIGRQACLVAGRPEFYREEDIYYATYSQFGYAATVAGTMVRERPAVNFFMGNFAGEALVLAETGFTTGAMQIAGCDSDTQLPFFITTCDYTLIGEELYAASAYLTRDPVLLGSLRGQDIAKAVLITLILAGVALAIAGLDVVSFLR
jgi:hypothetical protein